MIKPSGCRNNVLAYWALRDNLPIVMMSIDELRLGKSAAGEADIAAAMALTPKITDRMRSWDINP